MFWKLIAEIKQATVLVHSLDAETEEMKNLHLKQFTKTM